MDKLSVFFQPVLYIILAVTFFFNSSFGFLKAKVVTVPENGSLVCVDELGRSIFCGWASMVLEDLLIILK